MSHGSHDEHTSALVLIASTGGPVELDAEVLVAMRQPRTRVRIVADGELRFDGDYQTLAARGASTDGLAGEHPVERIVRALTGSEPTTESVI